MTDTLFHRSSVYQNCTLCYKFVDRQPVFLELIVTNGSNRGQIEVLGRRGDSKPLPGITDGVQLTEASAVLGDSDRW